MSNSNVNAALSLVDESTPQNDEFLNDVLMGLTQSKKTLPCKYFYDEKGSQLFEAICDTDEYYVTRTEIGILQKNMNDIAQRVGPGCDILEFGSGAGVKIQLLLSGLHSPRSYIPIDISMEILEASSQKLAQRYPDVSVVPIVGDYHKHIELPEGFLNKTPHKKLVFFPGSTISNFAPDEAQQFLQRIHQLLSPGDGLLIGVDCVKPIHLLNAAYNDAAGITAAFNLNLLDRIANTFDTNLESKHFLHHAFFNNEHSRIEMHLVSKCKQVIQIAGETIHFERGETIHTENSYKYSLDGFKAMVEEAAFEPNTVWQDEEQLFSLHYLTAV